MSELVDRKWKPLRLSVTLAPFHLNNFSPSWKEGRALLRAVIIKKQVVQLDPAPVAWRCVPRRGFSAPGIRTQRRRGAAPAAWRDRRLLPAFSRRLCARARALEQVSDPGRNSGRRSGGCRTAENPLPQAKWVTSANPSTLPFLSPIGWISSQWLWILEGSGMRTSERLSPNNRAGILKAINRLGFKHFHLQSFRRHGLTRWKLRVFPP